MDAGHVILAIVSALGAAWTSWIQLRQSNLASRVKYLEESHRDCQELLSEPIPSDLDEVSAIVARVKDATNGMGIDDFTVRVVARALVARRKKREKLNAKENDRQG